MFDELRGYNKESASRSERRVARRATLSIGVRAVLSQVTHLCQAANISQRGMLLAKAFDEGINSPARCLLSFTMPGSEVLIVAKGSLVRQVRRGRYHYLAIAYLALAPSHRRLISRYIRAPSQLGPRPPFSALLTPWT